ncbi:MAG: type II CRISPR-associated endonuclease Cas1 [Bryobacter sp.]|nr:type II CRISPR-associated endonuclease Cas1 [Bryobacter sp.]
MTNRILDFSNQPAHLHAKGETLEIKLSEGAAHAIPFAEIAALIAAHPQVTISQSALARLSEAGGVFVICSNNFTPVAMTLPLESHWYQADRFVRQAALTEPRRKRLWQSIVREKIRMQAMVLAQVGESDHGLSALVARVQSGDPQNVEARAARTYWSKVFRDKSFVRSNPEDPRNALLNYGYAVLRACVARAIAASGLHPSFGLHHRNKLNAFPLADDLMEPFRPLVDAQVLQIVADKSQPVALVPQTKQSLLSILGCRFASQGENRSLFDILSRMAQSLARFILDKDPQFLTGLDSPFPLQEEANPREV